MALYGTNVPPFEDPGITIDYISIKLVESQQYSCLNCDHSPGNAGIKAHKYCCRMGHHSYVRWLINHEINPSNYSCINLPKSIEFSHFSKATATHLFSEESRQASSARCSYRPRPPLTSPAAGPLCFLSGPPGALFFVVCFVQPAEIALLPSAKVPISGKIRLVE